MVFSIPYLTRGRIVVAALVLLCGAMFWYGLNNTEPVSAEPALSPKELRIVELTSRLNRDQSRLNELRPALDEAAMLQVGNRKSAEELAELGFGVEWGTGSVKVFPFPGVVQQ